MSSNVFSSAQTICIFLILLPLTASVNENPCCNGTQLLITDKTCENGQRIYCFRSSERSVGKFFN